MHTNPEEDDAESQTPHSIPQYFSDPNVKQRFQQQFKSLQKVVPVKRIAVRHGWLAIYIDIQNLAPTVQPQAGDGSVKQFQVHDAPQTQYLIAVNISYPLPYSVQLHLLKGAGSPSIDGIRDLTKCVLGKAWDVDHSIAKIGSALKNLTHNLQDLNEKPLLLQKTGEYIIGTKIALDYITVRDELQRFRVNQKYKKESDSKTACLTESYVLIFNVVSKTGKAVLESAIQMQAICFIMRNKDQLVIRYKKYKLVKGFVESQVIQRRWETAQGNLLLRSILKRICKFQTTELDFVPAVKSITDSSTKNRLQTIRKLESQFFESEKSKHEVLIKLDTLYNKMLEYYTSKGDNLYLVYVNKINTLYSHTRVASRITASSQ